ncbi:MAG TPA: transposase, partial [Gaiellaceae bacterium]
RHRLDRGGNRQLNCALHRIAITQSRVHPPARAYLERKQAEGKSRREALRCLKTTTRTHRLQHAQERAAIDIGATLAQPKGRHI